MDKESEEYEEFTINFDSEKPKSSNPDWSGRQFEGLLNSFTPTWRSMARDFAILTAASVFVYVVLDLTGRAISKWLD